MLEALLELVFHGTAQLLMPLLTFGRIRTEHIFRPSGMSALGVRRTPDGTIVIGSFLAIVMGVLIWVAVALGMLAIVL
jgi:hypothetical protein